jgi:IS5 family transposase
MLLVGLWHGGLSDESVEDMANANLHVMRFLGLDLEDDVRDSFGTVPFQDTIDESTGLG